VHVSPHPTSVDAESIVFDLKLPARSEVIYEIQYACLVDDERPEIATFEGALEEATEELATERVDDCAIESSNAQFNDWIGRSFADLHLMTTETPYGPYP